nr:hypothetical protein 34 [bacterium]
MKTLESAVSNFFKGCATKEELLFLKGRALSFKDSDFSSFIDAVVKALKAQILDDAYTNGKNKNKSSEMLIGEINGLLLVGKVLDDFILRADETLKASDLKPIEDEEIFPYTEDVDPAEASQIIA